MKKILEVASDEENINLAKREISEWTECLETATVRKAYNDGLAAGEMMAMKTVQGMIVSEILIARKEGTAISRLTSLAMKIKSLK